MGIGPVEYGVVAFPGNKFKGEIAPALGELVESGTIRIIDLAFVLKDSDGNVAGVELEDAGYEVLRGVRGDHLPARRPDQRQRHARDRGRPRPELLGAHHGLGGCLGDEVLRAVRGAGGIVVDAPARAARHRRGCHRLCERTGRRRRLIRSRSTDRKGEHRHDATQRPRTRSDGRRHRGHRRDRGAVRHHQEQKYASQAAEQQAEQQAIYDQGVAARRSRRRPGYAPRRPPRRPQPPPWT